jgi:predicted metal-binding protein
MEKYKQLLLNMGSDSIKIISTQSIVTAPWTIYKCQYGCKRYGKGWCCPPKTPGYKQTQEIIDCFHTAILFRCHDMTLVTEAAINVNKEIFVDGYYKAIAFGSGPCLRCKECNTVVCNFQGNTIPSMEACGIDVFQTARNNGYEITTLRSRGEIQNHFGLILVE